MVLLLLVLVLFRIGIINIINSSIDRGEHKFCGQIRVWRFLYEKKRKMKQVFFFVFFNIELCGFVFLFCFVFFAFFLIVLLHTKIYIGPNELRFSVVVVFDDCSFFYGGIAWRRGKFHEYGYFGF